MKILLKHISPMRLGGHASHNTDEQVGIFLFQRLKSAEHGKCFHLSMLTDSACVNYYQVGLIGVIGFCVSHLLT